MADRHIDIWLATALLIATASCTTGGNDSGLVERGYALPSPRQVAADQVEALDQLLSSRLEGELNARTADATLRAGLASAGESFSLEARYAELLPTLYESRDDQSAFVDAEGGLTQRGQLLREALADSWVHALRPADYGIPEIDRLLESTAGLGEVVDGFGTAALQPEERSWLVAYLSQRPDLLELGPEAVVEHLLQGLLQEPAGEETSSAGFPTRYRDFLSAASARQQNAVELEIRLAAGFLRYAYDMRYFNPRWFPAEVREDEAALEAAVTQALTDAFDSALGEEGIAAVLERLPPHHQQYGRLLEAHRRYRQIVAEGGWPTDLRDRELRLGRDYDMVPRLRRRLHIEGYFDGDLESREFDRAVRDALQVYQRTHQFRDNGRLSEAVVDSLNTPALYRAQQIAVALQRWRESRIGNDEYYVFVNIPDFHVEVWRMGNRDLRHRIIVGSTQRLRRESDGQLVFPRATPELSRPMRYVVFNPYWNVPPNIMINEYDPNLRENPLWYEENGYEVLYNEYGQRWVRQLPGPENALGEVKFLFPNDYDVYLHDTPMRHLFERTQRTFSHGCMRVENPMLLAEYILGNDRGWDRERIDEERASGEETWVSLRHPIPVHVEFYVVRVDDDGHANFLSDLYLRDQPRMEAVIREETGNAVASATAHIANGLETAVLTAQIFDAERAATAVADDARQSASDAAVETAAVQ